MAARNRPYGQFGPYVLFKKLESEALTELWRAARIEGNSIGGVVALRRFHAGNREALVAAAHAARQAASQLAGTSFVKAQTIDVIDNTPFVAHEYAGGRSLRHIVERARGGAGMTPNPIPIDQAIAMAEKVALSVATMSELRYAGERMIHGALIPQFVWISDDGETRVSGQMLGPGIVPSLRDTKIGAEIGRYFSPEYQSSGIPSPASEIYALGAILYLVVTGLEPPDPVGGSAFHMTIRSARTMGGAAIPNDIRAIIEKSLVIDRNARYATVADMKQELSALAHGGKYTATTFNLAFYLSTLLKKELEGEAIDREKESKVNAAPYVEALAEPSLAPATVDVKSAAPRRRLPLAVAAAVAVAAVLGIGAYFAAAPKPEAQPAKAALASAAPVPQPTAPVIPEPIVVASPATNTAPSVTTSSASASEGAAARQKAFEDAVKQRMQAEMMKLQAQYTRQLQQQQSKNAPIVTASAPAPPPAAAAIQAPDDQPMSAAQLDQQRRESLVARPETAPQQASPQSATVPPTQSVAPQPAAPTIQEGDIVDVTEVDTAPKPLGEIRPSPPLLAIRQHVQGSVVVTAFVSEDGRVLDAKVLSGIGRFGVDDAALRAVRTARFSPAMKNGKRVKVWMPLRFDFKL